MIGDQARPKTDLFKEEAYVRIVERVLAHEHRVEDDPEAPDVGHLAGIAIRRVEYFGADVGQAAVLIRQPVVCIVR